MYERVLAARLRDARRSVLLLGPRQVGKSTLLAALGPDLTLNLADPATFRRFAAHPELLADELGGQPEARTVLIDEVQRIPELLQAVQVELDRSPRRARFLLSGSSARKLRRGQANLLAGRIHVHYLSPLFAAEIGRDFELERALAHGTLPGIYAQEDAELRSADLRAYADVYLREEVQAEALVRDIGGYARLLDLVASASGKLLNVRGLSMEVGLGYETVRRYVQILEDTLLVFPVLAWSGSDTKTLVAHPKLYLFDVGVRNALLHRPLGRCLRDERGLLLEHYLAQELHGRTRSLWPELRLRHFRSRGGAEVDFVLEIGRETWGVEVKASWQVSRRDLSGLTALADRCKTLKRRVIVYLGPRPMKVEGVEVLPLERFLAELPR
jgi:predicted AAA+ superfamily ATPase